MIKFSDLIGKTVKVIDVKGSEYDEDDEYSKGVTLEVDGVQYTLEAIVSDYDDAEIWLCEKDWFVANTNLNNDAYLNNRHRYLS